MSVSTRVDFFPADVRIGARYPNRLSNCFRIFILILCAALAGCCDLRLVRDDAQGPKAYTPTIVGHPRFVLDIYGRSNFDLSHSDLGQDRISMTHRDLKPIGQNYARSVVLKADTGTVIEITGENGRKGVGQIVGPEARLLVPDICVSKPETDTSSPGSYKTDGRLSCRVVSMVVRERERK